MRIQTGRAVDIRELIQCSGDFLRSHGKRSAYDSDCLGMVKWGLTWGDDISASIL
jgi:hypothetical protein